MSNSSFTDRETKIIREVLAPFADKLERVAVFGSRATGAAKSTSDIDLVLYGDIDEKTKRRIWTNFSESSLGSAVDVVAYSLITHEPLRLHIDAVAAVVLDRDEVKDLASSFQEELHSTAR